MKGYFVYRVTLLSLLRILSSLSCFTKMMLHETDPLPLYIPNTFPVMRSRSKGAYFLFKSCIPLDFCAFCCLYLLPLQFDLGNWNVFRLNSNCIWIHFEYVIVFWLQFSWLYLSTFQSILPVFCRRLLLTLTVLCQYWQDFWHVWVIYQKRNGAYMTSLYLSEISCSWEVEAE